MGQKNLKGAEGLELFFSRPVIPRTEERPEVGLASGREVGVGQIVLSRFVENEVEELASLVAQFGVVPSRLPPERPEQPGLVVIFDPRVTVERSPTVDVAVIATSLHPKRPEVMPGMVWVGGGAVDVSKKWPQVGFAPVAEGLIEGVERQKSGFEAGRVGIKFTFLAVEERPQGE